MRVVSFVLIIFLNIVSGLILPGPCPEMPPTQTFPEKMLYYVGSIYTFIPFTETSSLIFGNIPSGLLNCHVINIFLDHIRTLEVNGRIFYKAADYNEPQIRMTSLIGDGKSVHVSAEVKSRPPFYSSCHLPMNETFSFWIQEDFGVFWSCREMRDGVSHDEGLILTVSGIDSKINSGKLREYAEKYIRNSLKDNITFAKTVAIPACPLIDAYPCPHKRSSANYTAVYLVAAIGGSWLLYIFCSHFFEANNQIEPME